MNPVFKTFIGVHTWLLRKSKGKRFNMGGTVLVLKTVGAKTGKPRANPLMYLDHDDGYLVAASAAGSDQHPGWYFNLVKNPDVEVELAGETIPMHARVAEGEERDQLYKRFEEWNKRFAGYQTKTSRKIPVVVLARR